MTFCSIAQKTAGVGLLGLALLVGCKSAEQKALDQAKAQAAATSSAQQVQYIDGNGDTVTTVVQPPAAGQTQQVQTNITPPPPGPPPHRTRPTISALGSPSAGVCCANLFGSNCNACCQPEHSRRY